MASYFLHVGQVTTNEPGDFGICSFQYDDIKNTIEQTSYYALPGFGYMVSTMDEKMIYVAASYDGAWLYAFTFNTNSKSLQLLNRKQVSKDGGLSHLQIDMDNRLLLTTCYKTGNIYLFQLLPDGSIGNLLSSAKQSGSSINKERQESAHPHSVFLAPPDNKYAVVPDLGADKLFIYHIDKDFGKLSLQGVHMVCSGMAPRFFTFHPNAHFGYLLTELSNHIIVYDFNSDSGEMLFKQIACCLPDEYVAKAKILSGADIHFSPDKRFLFASNREHNSLVRFEVNEKTGQISNPIYTKTLNWPRGFYFSKDGKYMFVCDEVNDEVGSEGMIQVFAYEIKGGLLSPLKSLPVDRACNLAIRIESYD